MDIKHQEETDAAAEKWLRKNKKLHDQYVLHHCGNPPRRNTPAFVDYQSQIAECNMKVEIINTEHAQLNLDIK